MFVILRIREGQRAFPILIACKEVFPDEVPGMMGSIDEAGGGQFGLYKKGSRCWQSPPVDVDPALLCWTNARPLTTVQPFSKVASDVFCRWPRLACSACHEKTRLPTDSGGTIHTGEMLIFTEGCLDKCLPTYSLKHPSLFLPFTMRRSLFKRPE